MSRTVTSNVIMMINVGNKVLISHMMMMTSINITHYDDDD